MAGNPQSTQQANQRKWFSIETLAKERVEKWRLEEVIVVQGEYLGNYAAVADAEIMGTLF